MLLFVPKETKAHEYRVGLTPAGTRTLAADGHRVWVERNAGVGAGFSDKDYIVAGARLIDSAEEGYDKCDMVVKVKEPLPHEYPLLRPGQLLFTYFHFAASRELTEAVTRSRATAIAYETLVEADGSLPLLIPMSEVAGRMSIQAGARHLEKPQGGRGILLGGVPGVMPAHVTILGGGVVGTEAAKMAAGLGAHVHVLDTNLKRLRELSEDMPKNVIALFSDRAQIVRELEVADLVIGAVLVRGDKAPHLIRRRDLRLMKPGSVIVDVAIDQGGCTETSRPTTHESPVYVVDDVVHYCVANMPGAVPETSTIALTNATFPYVRLIAEYGLEGAIARNPSIRSAINIRNREIVHPTIAALFETPPPSLAGEVA